MILAMLVVELVGLLVVLGVAGLLRWATRRLRNQRWAQVANRRAPVRHGKTRYDSLLEHLETQRDRLLAERQRLERLIREGQKLRFMMQTSAQLRPRVPVIERTIARLQQKAGALDELIGRFSQRRDDLLIGRAADRFHEQLEAWEARLDGDTLADPSFIQLAGLDALDDQAERLLAVAEAEDELGDWLRSEA